MSILSAKFLAGPDDEYEVVNNVATTLDLKLNIVEPSENILDSSLTGYEIWINRQLTGSMSGFVRDLLKRIKLLSLVQVGMRFLRATLIIDFSRFTQLERTNFLNDSISMLNNLRPNRYSLSLINKYGTRI